jgi:adenylylsulfate kinase-like enzyme
LSRSGKSTLADGIAAWLTERNVPTQILDGRAVRDDIGNFLGYSRDERAKVSRIMCSMAKLLNRNGIAVVATSITPYQESRDLNRATLENYFEIYLECSVDTCFDRDDTDNYARAQRGDLKHFIGVDDPFEVPKNSDLVVSTDQLDEAAALERATTALEALFATPRG